MAIKITKSQAVEKNTVTTHLADTGAELTSAINLYNEAMSEAWEPVRAALDAYNTALEAATELANDVIGDLESKIEAKSEKWQEGEAGQQATAMLDAWEGTDFSPIEMDKPDDLEEPDLEHEAILEDLQEEAE